MAEQVTVAYLDDVELRAGRKVAADHRKVRFSLDGRSYEIDLSMANFARLLAVYEPLLKVARRRGKQGRPTVRGTEPGSTEWLS
jgi:Lsr2